MSLDPITAFVDGITTVVNKIWPDASESQKQQFNLGLAELSANVDLAKAQMAINQQEAASPSLFVAGGRPFIMWVCGIAFAYHFVLQPFMAFILSATGNSTPLPVFDMGTLSTVLMGLLGLGGYRTIEKIKGVAGK